jgi:hypothetical protein
MTLMFLAMQGVTGYYLYMSKSTTYWKVGEIAMIYLIGITFLLGIIFSVLEQIASWKK